MSIEETIFPKFIYACHVNGKDGEHFGCWHSHASKKFYKEYVSRIEMERELDLEREKVRDLINAIEFYADGDGDVLDWDRVNNPACIQDRGKIAREALSKYWGNQ